MELLSRSIRERQPWVLTAFRALLTNCLFRRTASTANEQISGGVSLIT